MSRGLDKGARCTPVALEQHFDWPSARPRTERMRDIAARVTGYPTGRQRPWGIPFLMATGALRRVILLSAERETCEVPLGTRVDYLCILHQWHPDVDESRAGAPMEGVPVADYTLAYDDGTVFRVPVRARFEIAARMSHDPPWLAVPFHAWEAVNPSAVPPGMEWGSAQTGVRRDAAQLFLFALSNPRPGKPVRALLLKGLRVSPVTFAGLTCYRGASHPLRYLPRRTYRVSRPGKDTVVAEAAVDLGGVARIEQVDGPRGGRWLASSRAGLVQGLEFPAGTGEKLIEAYGAEDATMSVRVEGRRSPYRFSLGEAFRKGTTGDPGGGARLEVLGKRRQWMKVIVTDASTGRPTPVRLHLSGARGEYVAPHGHHAQVNPGWFMDYGADVSVAGRTYAYVPGEFSTDLPVGDLYVEITKGFEYRPVRTRVKVSPGQQTLELSIDRLLDWRRDGWVTADTHVHFISPHTAWLQAQAEGVNVVNLLASQWGRLFTNIGDITGKVGVVEDDSLVYVGTENRNHMLGHMSMLGTKGLPVFPLCGGGPSESWLGDPDFYAMTEWARENRGKGGLVIRPHFPLVGASEDPVPILMGLVDALEIRDLRGTDFPTQEWYRYLNCGYRVAVAGGTDKMGAYCALGWMRTYALLDRDHPFDYGCWARAVRAGRTFSTTGPLIDLRVEGLQIGDTISLPGSGGTLQARAWCTSCWPIGSLEIVVNGRVVAAERPGPGSRDAAVSAMIPVTGSGWIAARCAGQDSHPSGYTAAHTSPVYVTCGDSKAFDAPAAQHMLTLVEGSIAYMTTLASTFDESSRKRMVKIFREARAALAARLTAEGAGTEHVH